MALPSAFGFVESGWPLLQEGAHALREVVGIHVVVCRGNPPRAGSTPPLGRQYGGPRLLPYNPRDLKGLAQRRVVLRYDPVHEPQAHSLFAINEAARIHQVFHLRRPREGCNAPDKGFAQGNA